MVTLLCPVFSPIITDHWLCEYPENEVCSPVIILSFDWLHLLFMILYKDLERLVLFMLIVITKLHLNYCTGICTSFSLPIFEKFVLANMCSIDMSSLYLVLLCHCDWLLAMYKAESLKCDLGVDSVCCGLVVVRVTLIGNGYEQKTSQYGSPCYYACWKSLVGL